MAHHLTMDELEQLVRAPNANKEYTPATILWLIGKVRRRDKALTQAQAEIARLRRIVEAADKMRAYAERAPLEYQDILAKEAVAYDQAKAKEGG